MSRRRRYFLASLIATASVPGWAAAFDIQPAPWRIFFLAAMIVAFLAAMIAALVGFVRDEGEQ